MSTTVTREFGCQTTKFRANALPMNPAPPVTSTWDKVRDFSGSVVADIEGLVCVFLTVSLHGAAPWSAPAFTRYAECASWCRASPFRRACCRSGEHLPGDVAVVSTPPSARDFRSPMERVMARCGFFACSHRTLLKPWRQTETWMSARMVTDDQYSFHAERPRARFTGGGRRFFSGRKRSGSIKPETRWTAHPDTLPRLQFR